MSDSLDPVNSYLASLAKSNGTFILLWRSALHKTPQNKRSQKSWLNALAVEYHLSLVNYFDTVVPLNKIGITGISVTVTPILPASLTVVVSCDVNGVSSSASITFVAGWDDDEYDDDDELNPSIRVVLNALPAANKSEDAVAAAAPEAIKEDAAPAVTAPVDPALVDLLGEEALRPLVRAAIREKLASEIKARVNGAFRKLSMNKLSRMVADEVTEFKPRVRSLDPQEREEEELRHKAVEEAKKVLSRDNIIRLLAKERPLRFTFATEDGRKAIAKTLEEGIYDAMTDALEDSDLENLMVIISPTNANGSVYSFLVTCILGTNHMAPPSFTFRYSVPSREETRAMDNFARPAKTKLKRFSRYSNSD